MRPNAIYPSGQVAGLVGLPADQLHRLIDKGAVPAPPVGAGARRHWTLDDIERLRAALEGRASRAAAAEPEQESLRALNSAAEVETSPDRGDTDFTTALVDTVRLYSYRLDVVDLERLTYALQELTHECELELRECDTLFGSSSGGDAGSDRPEGELP